VILPDDSRPAGFPRAPTTPKSPFSRSRGIPGAQRPGAHGSAASGFERFGAASTPVFEKHPTQRSDDTFPVQRQLTLDLGTPPPATFGNFFATGNHELVTRLRDLEGALASGPVADRTFYIWGETGSGRSHLLHALVHESVGVARYLSPQSALHAFGFDPRVTLYAVDDCDRLSAAQQIAVFNLFNEVRATPAAALVAAGNAAPLGLDVRDDLRTRLGWGLVFHLQPLTDEAKASVLKHAARERGIVLAEDVPAYLLTRYRRDMPSLMALLDELDRFSLETKRAVNTGLIRDLLQTRSLPFVDDDAPPGHSIDHPAQNSGFPAPDNDLTRFK
jgi:DnaA-homolog protein